MHLYVSLYSLLQNNPVANFKVFIITGKINSDFKSKTPFLYESLNLSCIEYIEIDRVCFEKVQLSMHVTSATFDRLLVGSLLPQEIEKVLYLDCDTIIDKPIDGLLNLDIENCVLVATEDRDSKASAERIGLPAKSKYFNAGVLLINLNNWRKQCVEIKMLEYIQNNLCKLIYADQDVLNYVLYDKWLEMSPEYNYCELGRKTLHRNLKPIIIHYLGSPKPSYYMSIFPHRYKYWQYLKKTPYSKYREPDKTIKNWLIKNMYRIRHNIYKIQIIQLLYRKVISKE